VVEALIGRFATAAELQTGWTASRSILAAIMAACLGSVSVLWGLSWSGAEDAVVEALSDHLETQAGLAAVHLKEVPVHLLVQLGSGHAQAALDVEVEALRRAGALHDAALIGPEGLVLGSQGDWLPAAADADLIERARGGSAVAGVLYRAADGAPYLAAYAPLPDQPGWVVAIEGSATLGAVDRLAQRTAVASILVLAVSTLLGFGLAAFVARPLRRLEDELAAVSPGDPPDGITVGGPREARRVAAAAAGLLEAIRVRDAIVRDAHQREVAQLTRFAAEIAHEIRNPLNAMSLSSDRLARVEDPEKRARIARRLCG
jgi:hypothetical protein